MIGLLDLIDEHPDALAYDLIRVGLRLRDFPSPRLTWGDMLVMVRQAQPDTAIYKALNPDWQRTPELQLAQSIEMTLRWLQWAKTADGAKNRNQPEPVWFPWDERPDDGTLKGDVMGWDEAATFLGWDIPNMN